MSLLPNASGELKDIDEILVTDTDDNNKDVEDNSLIETNQKIQNFPEQLNENVTTSTSTEVSQTKHVQKIVNRKKTFLSPKKSIRQKKTQEDPRLTETFKIIQDISAKRQAPKIRDDCDIFGELVGSKLRKLDIRNRLIAQQQINNILFNAEMSSLCPQSDQVRQVYNNPMTTFSPSTSIYEMPRFRSQ